jgi:serine/threonine protein kinase
MSTIFLRRSFCLGVTLVLFKNCQIQGTVSWHFKNRTTGSRETRCSRKLHKVVITIAIARLSTVWRSRPAFFGVLLFLFCGVQLLFSWVPLSTSLLFRDIKPQNVLISAPGRRGEVRAMISDFGLCKKLKAEQQLFTLLSNLRGSCPYWVVRNPCKHCTWQLTT